MAETAVLRQNSAWPGAGAGPGADPGGRVRRRRGQALEQTLSAGRRSAWSVEGAGQWKESPQAQDPVAYGLSIVEPCFSIVSTKSIVAPPRYGALIRSVTTWTPPNSLTMSPSISRSSK